MVGLTIERSYRCWSVSSTGGPPDLDICGQRKPGIGTQNTPTDSFQAAAMVMSPTTAGGRLLPPSPTSATEIGRCPRPPAGGGYLRWSAYGQENTSTVLCSPRSPAK
jgi:hypothetical protein